MKEAACNMFLCLLTILLQVIAKEEICSEENVNSHLWRITNLKNPVYLFGTLHVPYLQVWRGLPDNVKTAFASSDTYTFELDTQNSDIARQIYQLQILPNKGTIDQVLSEDMYRRVERYIENLKPLLRRWISKNAGLLGGFYTEQMMLSLLGDWKQKRPVWLLILLNTLTESHIEKENGRLLLDIFLRNAASGMGKDVDWLETAEDQMRPLNSLSLDEVTFALDLQLKLLEDYNLNNKPLPQTVNVVTEYTCGDFSDLVEEEGVLINNVCQRNMTMGALQKLHSLRDHLMLGLRYQRNKKMALKVIEKIVAEPEKTHFVAVGAGHLIGNRSVVHYMRLLGYDIEHVNCTENITGSQIPGNIIQLGDPSTVPKIIDFSEFDNVLEEEDDGETFTIDYTYFSTASPTTQLPTPKVITPRWKQVHSSRKGTRPHSTTGPGDSHSPHHPTTSAIPELSVKSTQPHHIRTAFLRQTSSATTSVAHHGTILLLCLTGLLFLL